VDKKKKKKKGNKRHKGKIHVGEPKSSSFSIFAKISFILNRLKLYSF